MNEFSESAAFARVAADLHGSDDAVRTGRAVVELVKGLVPEAESVALSVRTGHGCATQAAVGGLGEVACAIENEVGEGPCLAPAVVPWMRSGDVGHDARWSRWGPRAASEGIGSVLAVPLGTGERTYGALNLYSARAGAFCERGTIDLVLVYAVHAANALAASQRITGLETAMESRHAIGMAQGLLMERFDLDEQASFEFLTRLSSQRQVKVRDLAQQVVDDPDGTLADG